MIDTSALELKVSNLKDSTGPGARFKRIVIKAFIKEGVRNIHDIDQCMRWAVGDMYAYLPYQNWGDEIKRRHEEIKFPPFVPVYIVMRATAKLWRREQRFKKGIHMGGSIG